MDIFCTTPLDLASNFLERFVPVWQPYCFIEKRLDPLTQRTSRYLKWKKPKFWQKNRLHLQIQKLCPQHILSYRCIPHPLPSTYPPRDPACMRIQTVSFKLTSFLISTPFFLYQWSCIPYRKKWKLIILKQNKCFLSLKYLILLGEIPSNHSTGYLAGRRAIVISDSLDSRSNLFQR